MKPHRLKLAHHLVLGYGLYRKMEVYVSGVEWSGTTERETAFLWWMTDDDRRRQGATSAP